MKFQYGEEIGFDIDANNDALDYISTIAEFLGKVESDIKRYDFGKDVKSLFLGVIYEEKQHQDLTRVENDYNKNTKELIHDLRLDNRVIFKLDSRDAAVKYFIDALKTSLKARRDIEGINFDIDDFVNYLEVVSKFPQ